MDHPSPQKQAESVAPDLAAQEDDPLEGLPRMVLGSGIASVVLLVSAWGYRLMNAMNDETKDMLETLHGIDFVLSSVTIVVGVGLLVYFRYGPLPSREGARHSAWGANLGFLSL